MAQICIALDRSGTNIMNDEYVYVDAKHDRRKNVKTLTIIMDCTQSNTKIALLSYHGGRGREHGKFNHIWECFK